MPRYYFHVEDGSPSCDDEGLDLPDHAAARRHAAQVAARCLEERPLEIWDDGCLTVTVKDRRGLTLFMVTVAAHQSAAVGGAHGSVEGPRA